MSGIPTPRPSKLAAPGSIARSTTSAISRTAAAPAIAPKKGLKRLNGEEKASDAAIKRARTAMGAPTVGAAKKPVSSSSLASAARKPLATRNTIGSRSNSGSSLNERRMTVAGTQPTTEKPRAAVAAKTKRQPWDLKGKMEDMQGEMRTAIDRIMALETEKTTLQTNVEEKTVVVAQNSEELDAQKRQCKQLNEELDDMRRKMRKMQDEHEDDSKTNQRKIENLEYTKGTMERQAKTLEDELNAKQAELSGLRKTVAELTSSSAGIEAKLKSTQMQLDSAREKVAELTTLSTQQAEDISVYESKQRSYETERRQLHNTIQELKGNIRVFCRIRPLLGAEIEKHGGQFNHIIVQDDKSLEISKPVESPTGTGNNKIEKYDFDFDHVFNHKAGQDTVFDEVSQLIQSAIDGYNVCIFAYGQTGSGKTFTMEGDETGKHVGIIPRTIEKIFQETSGLTDKGWKYKMEASFLEIYNEEIRDLLATEKGLKYDIKRVNAKSNEIYVSNLKIEDVSDGSENIKVLLKRAQKNRAVAATNCNERSSRSHSVFVLKITGKNSITSESCTGTLNLVDLAGSERLKDSGSTGQRLEETKSINSSLSNLSKVIMALANNKDGHIPYRDSKLTHLLMSSLGGNSKTLMFVNLSPREDFFNETLNSLRFAKRVNSCQIGTATKKINAV